MSKYFRKTNRCRCGGEKCITSKICCECVKNKRHGQLSRQRSKGLYNLKKKNENKKYKN